MKKYYTPLGVILTIIGSAVLVISLKARRRDSRRCA